MSSTAATPIARPSGSSGSNISYRPPLVNDAVQSLMSNTTATSSAAAADSDPAFIPVIAIHGGASASAASLSEYRAALNHVLLHGQRLLQEGQSALDIAADCCRLLEDIPVFNAGIGSVFNCDGEHELDASCMRGSDMQSGSVVATRILRNPILVAKRLLEKGNTVLLAGRGADVYGQTHQCCEIVPNSFFDVPARRQQFEATQKLAITIKAESSPQEQEQRAAVPAIEQQQQQQPATNGGGGGISATPVSPPSLEANDMRQQQQQQQQPSQLYPISTGTVGVTVLDVHGDLAAATSSGGLTNKPVGRVADSGVIGAGTYASNRWAAVSCSGSGEILIRCTAACSVIARMRFAQEPFFSACDQTIFEDLAGLGGVGGLIAVDSSGNVAMPFNSTAMPRGFVQVQGAPRVAVVREPLKTLAELEPVSRRQYSSSQYRDD